MDELFREKSNVSENVENSPIIQFPDYDPEEEYQQLHDFF